MAIEFTDQIEWPNGMGYTPCTKKAFECRREIDYMSMNGEISMDDMSSVDYENYNRLLDKLACLQGDGHFGTSVRF